MIRTVKPAAPAVLTTKGAETSTRHCTDHDADPDAYRTEAGKFTFQSGIYGHDDVKAALRAAQHDKCAFCDSDMMHTGYGDVEHFRPKAAWQQREGDPLRYPGYFWLAYDWDNLFLSCQLCNQRYKRNLFPLRVQRGRADSLKRDTSGEDPVLLTPSADVGRHITFVDEVAVPVNRSVKGRETIRILALNRDELMKRRRKFLDVLSALRDARDLLAAADPTPDVSEKLARLNQLLDERRADTAEYTAMARAFLG
jgi:uncharacterized protein (TIGR02646 family)